MFVSLRHDNNVKKHVFDAFEMEGLRKIQRVSWTAEKTNAWVLNKAGVTKELLDTVQSKKASILWSHDEETRELRGERYSARNNAMVHAGEEGHARPGWTTSSRGQDSPPPLNCWII